MQLPTINSQNCFWVAYLVIYLFMHYCVGDREEKHQPHGMFWVCDTQCQPGGGHSCPQVQQPSSRLGHSACTAGRGWHLGCEWWVGCGLCQWDNESPALWGSLWSTRKALGEHPQAGHTGRTLLNSFQHGHITQIPLEDGPWPLIPHSKWENKCLYSEGFFLPVNFSLLGRNQHLLLSQGRELLSVGPIFPCLEYHEPHILVICTTSQGLDGHLRTIQDQVSKQGDDKASVWASNRTSSHPKSHTQLSPGME